MGVDSLPQYVSQTLVRAGQIKRVYPTQLVVSTDVIGAPDPPLALVSYLAFHFPPGWFTRFDPKVGDMFLALGEERSVCSLESFLEGYTRHHGSDSRP